MSEFDSPEHKKTRKPLTATQQLKNLLDGMLDEEGCPENYRMTKAERARWERMRKAADESRIDERQAREFIERLRESLAAGAEPVTKEEAERGKKKLLERVESEVSGWEQKAAKRKADAKPKYIN
jgi:hypothetical protein